MKSRRIACVIHSLHGGGAERVMALLANGLAERGHGVTLVTLDDGREDRHRLDDAVRRHPMNADHRSIPLPGVGSLLRVRARQKRLGETLFRLKPEVVLSFCDRMNLDVLAGLKSVDPSQTIPTVICERSDPSHQRLGLVWETLRRRLYPRADAIVALTEASAAYLRRISNRVEVIPSAVRSPSILSDRAQASCNHRIVAAGRLASEKRFDRLIDAFHLAFRDDPKWNLEIYGDGPLRTTLAQQIESLGLSGRIHLPGWVSPLDPKLAEATCFCLSSQYEGFPSVILEAMSMGVPVVSVDCDSGPREIIRNEVDGLLVHPSTEGLRSGLERIAQDSDFRERLGKAGVSVVDRFGIPAMLDQFEKVLEGVVQATPR